MSERPSLFSFLRSAWLRWRVRKTVAFEPGPTATVERLKKRVETDNWDEPL